MALISIIEGFHPLNDESLLARAAALAPALRHELRKSTQLPSGSLGKGDTFDFVSFDLT